MALYVSLITFLSFLKVVLCVAVCKRDQLMRTDKYGNYICCYTVICERGQKYAFCDHDQGHDTCSNCPEGMYHLDKINTAIMNSILDPCIPKPTCDQPEVTLENNECVCDRRNDYYGNDINNCFLAEMSCSIPGFELKNNGKCEPCDEEFFKPEASSKHLCRPKSKCYESQEIDNNGSTTEDRACRAKTVEKVKTQTVSQNTQTDTSVVVCSHLETVLERIAKLEKRIKRLNRNNKRSRSLLDDILTIKRLPIIQKALSESKVNANSKERKSRKRNSKRKEKENNLNTRTRR